jgi:hypothetical protein
VLEQAKGRLSFQGNDLVFEDLRVQLAESTFTLDGAIRNVGGPHHRGPDAREGL